jgi:hypothetical protein
MTQPVTCITKDATLDDLSTADYRDMYDELRLLNPVTGVYTMSLDKFVTLVSSQYSKAQWSKYHNGETTLTRTMRNELRRCVGLKLLPPTVAEATAASSPDAAVWQVGDGPAEHVIMVTTQEPITLYVNGSVSVAEQATQTAQHDAVTPVTQTGPLQKPRTRPTASVAQENRRLALGVKWAEIIERGLRALESESHE